MRTWWRSCGAFLCGLACAAGLSYPLLDRWLEAEAARRFSADGAITAHGEVLLAFCWFLGAGLLGLAGCGVSFLSRPGGREVLGRLLRDEAHHPTAGGGPRFRLLAASAGVAVGLIVAGLGLGRLRWLFVEDGPVELAQVALLGGAALLFGREALFAAGRRRWPAACLAGACLLWLGEEVSWGQRLFGWSTPGAWAELNVQQETNLHNLVTAWPVELHNLLPCLPLALLIASVAVRFRWAEGRADAPRALAEWLPPPSLAPLALAALACQALRLAGLIGSAELEELALVGLVFLWALAAHLARRSTVQLPLGALSRPGPG